MERRVHFCATECLTAEQANLLQEVRDQVKELHVVGGPAAVPATTLEILKALLGL